MKNLVIKPIDTSNKNDINWVNEQYTQINFVPSSNQDYIVIAEFNGKKAGIGRIVPIRNDNDRTEEIYNQKTAGELGGIYVLPEHRGKEIAHKILETLSSSSKYDILYCIAFSHLENFYRKYGFNDIKNISEHGIRIHKQAQEKYHYCLNTYAYKISFLYNIQS